MDLATVKSAIPAVLLLALLQADARAEVPQPVNGDCNADGTRDISDAIYLLTWLFSGGPAPVPSTCTVGIPIRENGDANGDGSRDISDAVHLLSWLFGGGGPPVSEECETVGPSRLRFVAMGNTGKGNETQRLVAAAIRGKCEASGCDFVVLLGNNIYDSGVESVDDDQWETKFERPYRDIGLDFYAVLGNHDYGGNGSGSEFGKGQHQVDYTLKSSKWKMPAPHYHFAAENAEFFALDTNLQMYGMDTAQRSDVVGWLAASTAQWKIAIGHHPYLSNGPHGNAGEYDGLPFVPIVNGKGVKTFMESVVCGKADLYLCSHDQSLQWLEPTCSGTELIVSGTGASSTELPGDNPTRYESLEPGFVYVVIEGGVLTAEFIDASGNVLFTRSILKE